ncbi:MAG TPA: hydantoinase/oxoprolinase family protein [Actinomycetes bacterium]|nr:hydantoinase/oxoprolinase family protein [Actinomycetes bacterium]
MSGSPPVEGHAGGPGRPGATGEAARPGAVRVGVDVGGTFTDLVALVDGRLLTAKVPSTPRNQAAGVLRALEAAGVDPGAVAAFAHGSTVATNALLERRGARTALVTTAGFRDVIEIGRQQRPALYDLARDRPPPLVPRELRFTVRERTGPEGAIIPLDPESLAAAVAAVQRAGVEAVAVCLLFSFLHPEHERRVGEALRKALDGVAVSLSSDVLPEFREYERFSTTVADAYLTPRLATYLERLDAEVRGRGYPAPLVMQSSGGVIEIDRAARHAASCVLSGPAGGVVGAAWVAGLSGHRDLLTFDMGGTSTDVAAVLGGNVQTTTESVIGGVPIKLPMVDVHSVSAGGGSVAWVDEGGALRVGPHSAGADPGPAAYGLGGDDATVTDANLLLGYLEDGTLLGGPGGVTLRRALAERALRRLGDRLGHDPVGAALGVVRVANAEMVRALRVISVERGIDPRELVLLAFGGAGGMHACALAEELGMSRVLLPQAAGVLSALGLAISDLRRDYVRPLLGNLDETVKAELEAGYARLEELAVRDLGEPAMERQADLRYRGQSFELTVPFGGLDELASGFHVEHSQRYGYRMDDEPVELVSLRLVATLAVPKPALRAAAAGHEEPGVAAPGGGTAQTAAGRGQASPDLRRRPVNLDGDWHEVAILEGERLGPGSTVAGPAVIEYPESTVVVRPGWRGTVDRVGSLDLERD